MKATIADQPDVMSQFAEKFARRSALGTSSPCLHKQYGFQGFRYGQLAGGPSYFQ